MPDFSALSDLKLLDAEDGLHRLYDQRVAAGFDTATHEQAHSLVTKELRERGLMYSPLAKADTGRAPGKMNTASGKDGDSDGDQTNNQEQDPDNDGGVSQGSAGGNSEARGGSEEQTPSGETSVTDGPWGRVTHTEWMRKEESAPVRGTHPSKDDGIHTTDGTKRGKGGEKNRTQDGRSGDVDGDTDDKNPGDLGIITRKMDKSFSDAVVSSAYSMLKAMDAATPHEFQPVRNVCRNCKGSTDGHDDADHNFVPVRDVCRVCRQGQVMHKAVALGRADDLSIYKELPQLSNEQRMQMAEQGIALPDGSFPIPNEAFLHAAIGLLSQAPDPQAAMNHIIERAQAMGMEHALPPAWGIAGPSAQGGPAGGPGAHALGSQGPAPKTAGNAGPATDPGGTGMPSPGGAAKGGPGGEPAPGGAGMGSGPSAGGWADGTAQGNGTTPAAGGGASPAAGNPDAPPTNPLDPAKKKTTIPEGGMLKGLGLTADDPIMLENLDGETAILKALTDEGDRYTLAPVYMPETTDGHDEWATADDLQKSMWDYVEKTGGDRNVFLQHSPHPAGKWVDIVSWPFPVHAELRKSVDGVEKSMPVTFPARTVYMGIRWEPWAMKEILEKRLNGLSMGGSAPRIEAVPTR